MADTDNKEVAITDAFPADGVEVDRVTGRYEGTPKVGTFDKAGRYSGKLSDLVMPDEQADAEGTEVAESTESEDRGSPYELIPSWDEMNEYGQELLEPAEADQIRTEQEMLHKMVGPRDAAQTVSIIDGMSKGASEAVLLVIGEGNDAGMSGREVIAKIEGVLAGEDLQSFRNGLTQFPQSLKDLLEI